MNHIAELESEKACSETMRAAASMWKVRAESAEREKLHLAMALVAAAGGKIEVTADVLHRLPDMTLNRVENPRDHSICYTAGVAE